jgi:hypothetical protein
VVVVECQEMEESLMEHQEDLEVEVLGKVQEGVEQLVKEIMVEQEEIQEHRLIHLEVVVEQVLQVLMDQVVLVVMEEMV